MKGVEKKGANGTDSPILERDKPIIEFTSGPSNIYEQGVLFHGLAIGFVVKEGGFWDFELTEWGQGLAYLLCNRYIKWFLLLMDLGDTTEFGGVVGSYRAIRRAIGTNADTLSRFITLDPALKELFNVPRQNLMDLDYQENGNLWIRPGPRLKT